MGELAAVADQILSYSAISDTRRLDFNFMSQSPSCWRLRGRSHLEITRREPSATSGKRLLGLAVAVLLLVLLGALPVPGRLCSPCSSR